MAPNFRNSKIYRLVSDFTNLIYIGSTVQELRKRYFNHRAHFKKWIRGHYDYCSAYQIVMFSDFRIELVEAYPCMSLHELHTREQYWKDRTHHCCNKNDAILTENGILRRKNHRRMFQRNQYHEKKNHFCDICGVYINSQPSRITRHEITDTHQANLRIMNQII